jgi:hypothetical protein
MRSVIVVVGWEGIGIRIVFVDRWPCGMRVNTIYCVLCRCLAVYLVGLSGLIEDACTFIGTI